MELKFNNNLFRGKIHSHKQQHQHQQRKRPFSMTLETIRSQLKTTYIIWCCFQSFMWKWAGFRPFSNILFAALISELSKRQNLNKDRFLEAVQQLPNLNLLCHKTTSILNPKFRSVCSLSFSVSQPFEFPTTQNAGRQNTLHNVLTYLVHISNRIRMWVTQIIAVRLLKPSQVLFTIRLLQWL